MRHNLILTGDINPLGVTDPTLPFARVKNRLHAADVVFANLECCFYEPDRERSVEDEGSYTPLKSAEALTIAGAQTELTKLRQLSAPFGTALEVEEDAVVVWRKP
jgi:poly-gamma-glutamate synthesis protein (capsule biosynthesis protein)